jgi:Tol biopolymer transport system component
MLTGTRLGVYEIHSLLGAGGMGEVYRAHDTKLGRDVAIKILPEALAHDPDRRSRFEREARLLAALHHPHIATIFGVDDSTGVIALVMELVEGPTLAERIAGLRAKGSGLPVTEALAIASQLAEALDAAHEKGIVHRDLKPSNIKLTNDGAVKVLDFGLATAVASASAATSAIATQRISDPGTIVGTAAYMSPEQARGQTVDKRADIWAFGCVLYEMLTGKPAFSGATASDVMANVLQREPEWNALPAAAPPPLKRLIARCLEKDQKRRLRDIGDVRVELDDVPSPPASGAAAAPPARSRIWIAAPWLLLVAAAAAAVYAIGTRSRQGSPIVTSRAEVLTNDPGQTGQAALSPDGRLIAYASDRSGRGDMDIWVQQTSGGVPLRVTDDENDDQWPDFSPDGSQIAFRSERNGGGVYVVPSFGGAARLVAPDGRNPRFSPDGTRLAYWRGQIRGELAGRLSETYVIALSGGAPVRLLADFDVAAFPVWSPDGRGLLIQALKNRREAALYDWWWAPVDGSAPSRTAIMDWPDLRGDANRQNTVWSGPWTRSGFLIAEGARLLLLPLAPADGHLAGDPQALTFGVGTYGTPTMSRDGQIVFSSFMQVRTIERLPLGPSPEGPVQLFLDSNNVGWRASTTRDGSVIVFERMTSGRREIWLKNLGTGEQRLIMPVPSAGLVDATVSPDGSRFTYVIPDNGNPDFGKGFTVEIAGGVPRPACDGCTMWGFMPDSRRAIVSDTRSIRAVGDDGASQTLVTSPSRIDRPSVSPDGRAIAFRTSQGAVVKTFVAPILPSGAVPAQKWMQIDEPTTTGRPCGWSPDSSTLYLLLDADGYRDLWGQKVDASGRATGKPFVVRHLHHTTGVSTSFGNAITPQGFLYESTRVTGNLWRLPPQASAK